MRTEIIKIKGDWEEVVDDCRATVGKESLGKAPGLTFKRKILLAEHSPIRDIIFKWRWRDMPHWVTVHWVRHKWEKFVRTQRTDRTGIDRDAMPQNSPVDHECEANAQALIFISRRRLCRQASAETRKAWCEVKDSVAERDPVLASVMVPECVYRGFCPEFKSCGYVNTKEYQEALEEYRK